MSTLNLIRMPHAEGLELPSYETQDAAGMDLRAAVPENEPLILKISKRILVPTGLVMEIPKGHEGQIRPRSGLAYKNGITCLNTPGTIDVDYRGEVMVLLINHGEKTFKIERGMRIAQMVIAPVIQVEITESSLAGETDRGSGGLAQRGFKLSACSR